MQVFIPEFDFVTCAQVLDRQRLGKQRVEARNILVVLLGKPAWCSDKEYNYLLRYKNAPQVLQWKESEICLIDYLRCICAEWKKRGYIDNCWQQSLETCKEILKDKDPAALVYQKPWWLDMYYVLRHRNTLLYKNIQHYRQFGWRNNPRIERFYPVTKDNLEESIKKQREINNPKPENQCGYPSWASPLLYSSSTVNTSTVVNISEYLRALGRIYPPLTADDPPF